MKQRDEDDRDELTSGNCGRNEVKMEIGFDLCLDLRGFW